MTEEIKHLTDQIERLEKAYDTTNFIWMILGVICIAFAIGVGAEIETGKGLGAMAGAALLFMPLAYILHTRVSRLSSLREQLHDIRTIHEHESKQR